MTSNLKSNTINTNTLEPNSVATLVNAYTTQTGKMQIGSSSNSGVATNVGICVAPITTGTIRTISIGKQTVDSVHVANVEHIGPAISNASDPLTGQFDICTAQTTGVLNIGTGVRTTTGAINIGTASTTSAITIGNKTSTGNTVVINSGSGGILLASNNATAGRGIKITDNTVDVAIGTETLSIGATTGGNINIGTGSSSSSINIGNKTATTNTVVINAGSAGITLASTGTTGVGINVKGSTVDVLTAGDSLNLGTTNATGGITIGNTTQTNITVGSFKIGNNNISASSISSNIGFVPTTTTGDITLGLAQTSGILSIGTGIRITGGTINIGTSGTGNAINIGNNTNTANTVAIKSGSGGITLASGNSLAGVKVTGNTVDVVTATETLNIGTSQITGVLNIGVGARTGTGIINLGTGNASSEINIGKSNADPASKVTISAGTKGTSFFTGTSPTNGINIASTIVDTFTTGTLSLGTVASNAVSIGLTGITTVNNALTATGLTTANGGIKTSTIDTVSAGALALGTATANNVNIGQTAVGTTTVNNALTSTGELTSNSSNFKIRSSSASFPVSLLLGDSTDTTRVVSILNSALVSGTITYITLGQSQSLNNQTEIAFNWNGATGNNYTTLGMYALLQIAYGKNTFVSIGVPPTGISTASLMSGGLAGAPNSAVILCGNASKTDGPAVIAQSDGNFLMNFVNSAGTGSKGSIQSGSSSTVSYVSVSDKRLKTNIKPMSSMIDKIKQLNPTHYEWIEDGIKDDGFIAQEVHKIFPNFIGNVSTYCDTCKITRNDIYNGKLCSCCDWDSPTNKDGSMFRYGLDYGKFTPYLTKALQESIELIEKQQIKIDALETQVQIILQKLNITEPILA